MYAALARSATYAQIVRRAFSDLPEWVVPYSTIDLALLERFVQALAIEPGAAFLDLACGLGGPGLWVCERTGASLTGIDFAGSAVNAAKELARERGIMRASFVEADATDTGLPSGSFDALMSIDAIQFMNAQRVAGEVARVLRPSGMAAITTWEALVDDLPITTVAKDYRAVFRSAGFTVEDYEPIAGWRDQANALYEAIALSQAELHSELGEAAAPLLEEAHDGLKRAKEPPRVRKIFLSARRQDSAR